MRWSFTCRQNYAELKSFRLETLQIRLRKTAGAKRREKYWRCTNVYGYNGLPSFAVWKLGRSRNLHICMREVEDVPYATSYIIASTTSLNAAAFKMHPKRSISFAEDSQIVCRVLKWGRNFGAPFRFHATLLYFTSRYGSEQFFKTGWVLK